MKNIFLPIYEAIKYLLTFEEDTDFSKEKPDIFEDNTEWRANMCAMSEYCAREAFKEFQLNNILSEKFKNSDDIKLTSFPTANKEMKKKKKICV